ncbi:regulating synaptic membrane exocytosis protein 1-like isoform X1 [Stylophora pistillata]|uniref:regulating synaptic membrane exocytosis protein 1-like isoform X1 n=1 Tax=Stylophora pistillata TaxID=50429 RepID=UPI000C047C4D|nr:regulating synaptic membrane exocytosis protein 1-like isoform X1 [Stylophora pistillata]
MRKMAGFRMPASPPPPDLSNLTEEEKEIIQSVLERQKQMEEETNQLQLSLQKEVESYQHRVERKTGQAQVDSGPKEDNVCEICHKTKFTDGAGKECKYCKLKVCARCGVQVTIPGTKQTSQGQGLSLFTNLIQDFKTLALGPEVSWVCLVCQKKQEMLTKTGNWFGPAITTNENKPSNDSDLKLSEFRAIPTEEDKRAMRRQGSLHRSDSGRGSGRRAKGKDSERNRFRRPSVSDEEIDSLHETPPGSPAYLSDDELYRPDENKVRRKVVKFKGHEELDHTPRGRAGSGMPNMQRAGPMNQGPGRGLAVPGQAQGMRSGQPQQPQGPGVRPGGPPGGPHGRGIHGPGSQPGMHPNFPPQQQNSSFTPVGHPGNSSAARGTLPATQQQVPRGAIAPNQPRPGFGMRGPQQQPRFPVPQQQAAGGYGRAVPPGSQPAAPFPGQVDGKPGHGRGVPPGPQPGNHLGPRPGGPPVVGHPSMDNRPRQPGSFPPNHVGGPHPGLASPRPGDRMGPQQSPRTGAPPGMTQMGPRMTASGQSRHGMPAGQQSGQPQHPGQLGPPRLNLGPDPAKMQMQSGSPRQGPPLDQPPKGPSGSPLMGPDQMRGPMSSPRLGTPRNHVGVPQPGSNPEQGRGKVDGMPDQTRGRLGPSPQEQRLEQQPRGPYGNQPQGSPLDSSRGQYGPSQPGRPVDQGKLRASSVDKGPMVDQSGRQHLPDSRNGFSPEAQNVGSQRFPEQHAQGAQQRSDSRNVHTHDSSMMNGRMGPSFSNRQERMESRPVTGDSEQHGMLGQSPRPTDRPGYREGVRSFDEEPDGRRSPQRRISLDEPRDKSNLFFKDEPPSMQDRESLGDRFVSALSIKKSTPPSSSFSSSPSMPMAPSAVVSNLVSSVKKSEIIPAVKTNTDPSQTFVKWSAPDEENKCLGEVLLTIDPKYKGSSTDPYGAYGLKVIGGKMTEDGKLGAFITEIRKGGPAERQAKLQIGDEIQDWNEQSLVDCTFEEVVEIINSSMEDNQDSNELHLIVCRDKSKFPARTSQSPDKSPRGQEQKRESPKQVPTRESPVKRDRMSPSSAPVSLQQDRKPQDTRREETPVVPTQRENGLMSTGRSQSSSYEPPTDDDFFFGGGPLPDEKPNKSVKQTGAGQAQGQGQGQGQGKGSRVTGRIQLKLFYDEDAANLNVTVVGADGLAPKETTTPPNPYVRIYFLPDKSMQSKRRTKTAMKSFNPKWNQTFVYPCRPQKFSGRALEVTVWDYDKVGSSEFIGEVVLSMTEANLDGNGYWYPLKNHEDDNDPLVPPTPNQSPHNSFRFKGARGAGEPGSDQAGPTGYGSDYEEESRYTPNGPVTSSQPPFNPPENDLLKQQLIDHHRDSPRPPFSQQQMVQAYTAKPYHTSPNHPSQSPQAVSSYPHYAADPNRVPAQQTRPMPHQHGPGRFHDDRMSPSMHGYTSPGTYSPGRMSPSGGPGAKKSRMLPQLPSGREPMDEEERARAVKQKLKDVDPARAKLVVGGAKGRMGYGQAPDSVFAQNEGMYDPGMSPRPGRQSPRPMARTGSPSSLPGHKHSLGMPPHHQGLHTPQDRMYSPDMPPHDHGVPYESHRRPQDGRRRRNSLSNLPNLDSESERPRSPFPIPSPVPLGHGRSQSSSSLHDKDRGLPNGKLLAREEARSGSLNNLHVFPTGSYIKPSRGTGRSESFGGSGRSSRSSSIASDRSGSLNSIPGSVTSVESSPWVPPGIKLGNEGHLNDFIDGLGPAQIVGRQVLASPSMGDIQLALYNRRGVLEVEVIRAKGLLPKPGSKILPAPYVKVYVMDGKRCLIKKKTRTARRTLEPLYQQQLEFKVEFTGKTLQVIVWGDYGRMDRKVFMGVVQILLDELDLSNLVISWYKLFSTSSMCDPPLPSPSSPLGSGSPKKSPGPSPRDSMNPGVPSPMRMTSPMPTIIPPPGHVHNMDEEGDYV